MRLKAVLLAAVLSLAVPVQANDVFVGPGEPNPLVGFPAPIEMKGTVCDGEKDFERLIVISRSAKSEQEAIDRVNSEAEAPPVCNMIHVRAYFGRELKPVLGRENMSLMMRRILVVQVAGPKGEWGILKTPIVLITGVPTGNRMVDI
jgi:hypothetical protein